MSGSATFDIQALGPLASLVGVWEGIKGHDTAPSDDRGVETNKFRERITFTPIGAVNNHEQTMAGLRYSTVAHRLGEDQPFHEEVGYWLWDGGAEQVMRCFIVPRGITVLAGGSVRPDAREFKLVAELGSPTFGICSNPFLDREFKTVRYELELKLLGPDSWAYEEDTQILMKGRTDLFHHRDRNQLIRVK
jgi:hypothetical protein